MVLGMPSAPHLGPVGLLLNRDTIGAWRFDDLPRRSTARSVHEHRAGRSPDQAFRHRAEEQPREPLVTMGTDYDQVGADIARNLSDLTVRFADADVSRQSDTAEP